MRTVELYKIIKDDIVHVDYGIESQIDLYIAQGYLVMIEHTRREMEKGGYYEH